VLLLETVEKPKEKQGTRERKSIRHIQSSQRTEWIQLSTDELKENLNSGSPAPNDESSPVLRMLQLLVM
jgi:hypothetical protein